MIGRTLGHYRILELLGKGGMGEVYLAEDTRLQRRVALKILAPELAHDQDRRERFEREARAAAQLNHPHIVTIHSVEEAEGLAFLTLELVDGKTMSELIPTSGLPLDRLLQWSIPLADAVGAAHQRGITHRDLKPANVMLTTDGRVKVLDFGLAKLREDLAEGPASMPTRDLTGEGRVLGTIAYMSPEQAEGRAVDPRTDVFALGVVLYEMATGRRPFSGDTHLSVLTAILRDTPASVSQIKTDLPRELARIIQRCLAKDPEDRYQTAKDLRNDLRALRDDLASGEVVVSGSASASGSGPVPPIAAPPAAAKAGMARWLVAAAALVAVIAGGAYVYVRRGGAATADAAPPFSAIALTRLTTTGTAGVAAISGDGRYAAYVVTESGRQSLWLRQVTTSSNVQIVPPAAVNFDAVSFGPDGNYVYYVFYPAGQNIASLYQMPVLGGGPRKIVDDIDTPPAFSPDGRQFAFLRGLEDQSGTSLMLADATGSNVHQLAAHRLPLTYELDGVAWSPEGRTIAVAGHNVSTLKDSLVLIDAATGAERTLGSHDWRRIGYLAWLPDGSHLLVNAVEGGGNESSSQIFSVSYPDGAVNRVTNDLSTYVGLSLSGDGSSFVSVRNETRSRVWVMPMGHVDQGHEIANGAGADDGVDGLAWTPDGRVIYASATSGNLDIWSMNADGSNRVQLTSTPADDRLPLVPADGRTIVFLSEREGAATLWRMNIDGSAPAKLGAGPVAFRPVLSFDGQWVYYSDPARRNFRIPLGGGTPEPLLGELTAGGRALPPGFHEPMPSPDGRAIAGHYQDPTANGERVAVLSLDAATAEHRFPNVFANARWAPDGRSLMFTDRVNLFRQPIAGGPAAQITHFTGDRIFSGVLSSDQQRLALVRGQVASDVVLVSRRTNK